MFICSCFNLEILKNCSTSEPYFQMGDKEPRLHASGEISNEQVGRLIWSLD